MNKRRLLKMADFVETIPPADFNMGLFGHESQWCGTVGCALGWAAHKRIFRGLTAEALNDWFPHYKGDCGFGAAALLFEVPRETAEQLFDYRPNHHTPKQVAKNLRRYVETGELP